MNAVPKTTISDAERTAREAAVAYARGSVRLEGFALSAEVEEINRRFIAGELTGDQHIEEIKRVVNYG